VTAIFITATGTDVGKTFVAAALIRYLRQMGRTVDAIKPIVSGFDAARPNSSDPGILLTALGRSISPEEIDRISPWRFRASLSPDLAAQREGRTIDVDAVIEFCHRAMEARPDVLLIEGVGGIMVPLDENRTVLDWMMALRLPLILVTGSYLGTISHTLTALDSLFRREMQVMTIIVSETPGSPVPLGDTVATISRFAHPVGVIGLPRAQRTSGAPTASPVFDRLFDVRMRRPASEPREPANPPDHERNVR
jgi:dethiobiotin synthetase